MMGCLTHKQVETRFMRDLEDLCIKHNINIYSAADIVVEILPVYNSATNLYEEYGASFSLGNEFPNMDETDISAGTKINTNDFPQHQR